MKNRVFISGAQGFVGRYLVAHWLKVDPEAQILGVETLSIHARNVYAYGSPWRSCEVLAPLPPLLRQAMATRYTYLSRDIRQKAEMGRVHHELP